MAPSRAAETSSRRGSCRRSWTWFSGANCSPPHLADDGRVMRACMVLLSLFEWQRRTATGVGAIKLITTMQLATTLMRRLLKFLPSRVFQVFDQTALIHANLTVQIPKTDTS